MKKIKIIPIIIFVAIILVGGIYYLSQKNNWGCALDSQGIKIYVKALDLNVYQDKIESNNGGQILNDRNVITELRNKDITYAEDSNDCYGKHIYKIKINGELTAVNQKSFNEYLSGEKFNKNLCSEGAMIRQSGNSPLFVKYRFCTI
ncbi:MAG: hypothetical protein WCP24_03645 [bacterium]